MRAKEDGRIVADGNLAGENIGRHVSDDKGTLAVGARLKALGEALKLDAVDRLVGAVVDHGGVLGELPGVLVGDGAKLAVLAAVGDDVDVLGPEQAGCLGGGLLRPAAGDEVVDLELGVDDAAQLLHEGGLGQLVGVGAVAGLEVAKDPGALAGDPGANHVVEGGGELAGAAALHEEDLVVLGDVEELGEVLLGLVDDGGGQLGAVGVLWRGCVSLELPTQLSMSSRRLSYQLCRDQCHCN